MDSQERILHPTMDSLTHQLSPPKLLLSGLTVTSISGSQTLPNSLPEMLWLSPELEVAKIVPTLSRSSRVDERLTTRQISQQMKEKLFCINNIYILFNLRKIKRSLNTEAMSFIASLD